jgi:dethiobiotin synthetase
MKNAWFITGTDTGVGKTHVTTLLLRQLRHQGIRAAAMKPIACGFDGRNDARTYHRIMKKEVPLDIINPIHFRSPLAPSVAARIEHRRINMMTIRNAYAHLAARYSLILVEGAGGLMVPVKRDYFMADLARDMNLPVIVIARLGLGTINHTLLTVRQAKAIGLHVAGIILNDTTGNRGLAERTNIREVPAICGVPLFGIIPFGKKSGLCSILQKLTTLLDPTTIHVHLLE